jgi:hypothetical protein
VSIQLAVGTKEPKVSVGLIFLLILWAAFPTIIIAAFVTKMRDVRKAQRWLCTTGTVLVSRVESRKKRPGEMGHNFGDSDVTNEPLVEYSYKAGNRTYRSRRITIGEKTSEHELEAILERYPVGAEVTVYYDPAKPKNAVLERDLPMGQIWLGFGILMAFFLGAPLVGAMLYFDGVEWLKTRLPDPGRAPFVTAAGGFGLLVVWFALAFTSYVRRARKWPSVRGRIVRSGAEEYQDNLRGSDDIVRTYYKPCVIYTYEVGGREYSGDRIAMGITTSATSARPAERTAAKYPVGREVDVYYNPQVPSESVLRPGSRWHYIPWIAAACVLALAWAVATGRLG